MFRKILTASLVALALFFVGGVVSAQEDTDVTTPETVEAFEDIQEAPGWLTPGSPFYFLRSWQEGIERFFARSDEARTNLELKHAQRRIAEMRRLARLNKGELLEKVRERWQKHLEKAQERAEKMVEKREEVRERVLEATSKHLAVLEKVYEQAPEQAKEGLQRAIENAKRYQGAVLKRFTPEKMETLKERIRTRFESFRKKHNLLKERFKNLVPDQEEEQTEE